MKKVRKVVEYADKIGVLKDVRIRVSILDEYPHVKQRFRITKPAKQQGNGLL